MDEIERVKASKWFMGGGRIKNQGRGIGYDKDKVVRVQNIRYNSLFIVYCIFKTLNIGIEYKKYNFWRNQEHLRKEGGKIKYIEENMGIDLILFIISSALAAVCLQVHKHELFYAETESL